MKKKYINVLQIFYNIFHVFAQYNKKKKVEHLWYKHASFSHITENATTSTEFMI